jgi:hypothetical protein
MPEVYHAIRSMKALFSTIIKPILCSVTGRNLRRACCFERLLLPGNLFRNQLREDARYGSLVSFLVRFPSGQSSMLSVRRLHSLERK